MAKDKFESCIVCKSLGRSCHPGCAFLTLVEQQESSITPSKLEALCSFYNVSFIDRLARPLTPITPETLKTLEFELGDLYYRYRFYLENRRGNLSVVMISMENHVRSLLEKYDKEEEALRALIKNTKLEEGRDSRRLPNLEAQLFGLETDKSMRQLKMEMELLQKMKS